MYPLIVCNVDECTLSLLVLLPIFQKCSVQSVSPNHSSNVDVQAQTPVLEYIILILLF